MFGLVVRFDLLDSNAALDFDALTAWTSEGIRAHEPGTLLYVTNRVTGDPLARIFYEIYKDRTAFEEHEKMPHVKRFLAEREQYISATRVEFLTPTDGKSLPA